MKVSETTLTQTRGRPKSNAPQSERMCYWQAQVGLRVVVKSLCGEVSEGLLFGVSDGVWGEAGPDISLLVRCEDGRLSLWPANLAAVEDQMSINGI